jgi:hypothetical protein
VIGRLISAVRGLLGGGVQSTPSAPLNCRAGDLARIVAFPAGDAIDRLMPGRIVRVVEWHPNPGYGNAMWFLESPMVFDLGEGERVVWAIADSILRPIRDPGDDAQDEMLRLVGPAPSVTQPARESAARV